MRTLVSTLALALAAAGAMAAEPSAVFVTGVPVKGPDKAAEAALKEKSDAARKVYQDLSEALKKQFGKKQEAWPADKQEEWRVAHDVFFEAQTNWFYSSGIKQKDIDDSVRELSEALADQKVVRTATSPDEADFVIKVLGRAKVTNQDWGNNGVAAEIAMRVEPGARMDAATLARAGAVWNEKEKFWSKTDTQAVHGFTEAEPYWILISQKPGSAWMASYKGVAKVAAEAIGQFTTENADKLASSRRTAAK
jgi:hypothetical protein